MPSCFFSSERRKRGERRAENMPQNFPSTLQTGRRQRRRVGLSPQPAPHPAVPSLPPSPPASLPAPGTRFSPGPASASPPLPTQRRGSPLSPPLLSCNASFPLPAASSFSPWGVKAASTAGSRGRILPQNLQQHNWERKRLVRAHLPEIRLVGRNLDFIPPPLPPRLAACSFLRSNSPQIWTQVNGTQKTSHKAASRSPHRWHSPLQGAFPVFSPASRHHRYCLQRSFPASVSLTLGCKVIFSRLAKMLSRGLFIIVLQWTILRGFLVFSAYCPFIWIRLRGYNKFLTLLNLRREWVHLKLFTLFLHFFKIFLHFPSAQSNGHFPYLYSDFGGINSWCSAAWNMKVTLRNELTFGQVCWAAFLKTPSA